MEKRQSDILASGYQPVGISADTPEASRALIERLDLSLALLSDIDSAAAKAVGAWDAEADAGSPATIVIAKGGEILFVGKGEGKDRAQVDDVLNALGAKRK